MGDPGMEGYEVGKRFCQNDWGMINVVVTSSILIS